MSLVSLTELIDKVRRRSKLERQTDLVDNTEITDYLQSAYDEFAELISTEIGQGWLRDSRAFTTVANQTAYPIKGFSTNFFRLINCYVYLSGSSTSDILVTRPFMERERENFFLSRSWITGQPIYHRLMGSDLVLEPAPPGSISIQVNYIPTLESLDVNNPDSSKIDAINGWDDFLVWSAVSDVKAALDLDPTYAQGQAARARQRIVDMAGRRDEGGAERVNDVRGYWLGD